MSNSTERWSITELGQRSRARHELRWALRKAFSPSMTFATSALTLHGRRSIDNIDSLVTSLCRSN